MIRKPLATITPQELEHWILENAQEENSTWDFKGHQPDKWKSPKLKGKNGADQKAKLDFLKDVAAFMNAEGGDLIFGVNTKGEITGCDVDNADRLQRTLQAVLGDWLDPVPPFEGVQFRLFQIHEKPVFVVRVKRSWIGPHQVKYQKQHNYPVRRGNENSWMTHQQLLDALDRRSSFQHQLEAELEFGQKLNSPGLSMTVANIEQVASGQYAFLTMDQKWQSMGRFFWGGCSPRVTPDGFVLGVRKGQDWLPAPRIDVNRFGTTHGVSDHIFSRRDTDNRQELTFHDVTLGCELLKFLHSVKGLWNAAGLSGSAIMRLQVTGLQGCALPYNPLRARWGSVCELDSIVLGPLEIPEFQTWEPNATVPQWLTLPLIRLYGAFGIEATEQRRAQWWKDVQANIN